MAAILSVNDLQGFAKRTKNVIGGAGRGAKRMIKKSVKNMNKLDPVENIKEVDIKGKVNNFVQRVGKLSKP
jgi:hypothetical protein